ncbi:hypothetical protein [Burkholderia multivorans]|uniref:hypothetical protein n=1 Tax=Burkholderia multivorans TaxID=87883 RepID=UPI001FC856C5|nr:hypothetical protein [Burkholderia multivorans]
MLLQLKRRMVQLHQHKPCNGTIYRTRRRRDIYRTFVRTAVTHVARFEPRIFVGRAVACGGATGPSGERIETGFET